MISHHLPLAIAARDAIVEAVRAGELPAERLEQAAARVARLRATLVAVPGFCFANGAEVATRIARGAVTRLRGVGELPVAAPVTVISFEVEERQAVSLSLALRRRRFRSEQMRVPLEPDGEMREQLGAVLAAQPGRSVVVVVRRARLFPLQLAAIEAILDIAPDAIVLCALEPFDANAVFRARNVLCCYGDDEPTIEAVADVLAGRIVPAGTVPVGLAPS